MNISLRSNGWRRDNAKQADDPGYDKICDSRGFCKKRGIKQQ